MRIALIGPTYPYRGGLSHHTTLLCRALRKKHHVKFVSFSRQYPDFLFPGRTDRDESGNPLTVGEVEYLIDSLSPFTWHRAAQEIVRFRPQKLVVPWWVVFWTAQFAWIASYVRRRTGAEIIILCHNVVEHESNWLKKQATKLILSLGDRILTHSRQESERASSLLGDATRVETAFHPTYAPLHKGRYEKEEAKRELGLDGPVLLFFGFVREYKGLDVLLEALPQVRREHPVSLLVVGEFWQNGEPYREQIRKLDIEPHVRLVDRYVLNEELPLFFGAADLVVQPYRSASGSGVGQLAYGFGKPVVATRVGSLDEIVDDGWNGRLVEPEDPQELAQAIICSLAPDNLKDLTQGAQHTARRFSWEKLADIVAGEE